MSTLATSMGSESPVYNLTQVIIGRISHILLASYTSKIVSPSLSTYFWDMWQRMPLYPYATSGPAPFAMKPHESAYWASEIFFDAITTLAKQMIV